MRFAKLGAAFIRSSFGRSSWSRPAQTELISCLLPDVTVSWPKILHSPIFGNNSLGVPDSILLFALFFVSLYFAFPVCFLL